jgi:UrcA family protein
MVTHRFNSTPIHQEIHMSIKTTALATAAVACALLAAAATAKDYNVHVAIPVSTQGLDLTQPAGAQTFYTRLQQAAYVACTHGRRVDLAPVDNEKRCYEKALGEAIRAAKVPLLTQIYLQTHTLQEAAAHGIETPAQVAAK